MAGVARKVWNRVRRVIFGDPFWQFHARIATEFLHGDGIEIGALHNPIPVNRRTRVRYVDRMSRADLLSHYPDLNAARLVEVDVIDDGETLATVTDASQQFVIANHFLEHCQDPIGTLGHFFRVLKPDGVLYLSLPDKRYTFDQSRPVTTLEHVWDDHRHGPERSRRAHFEEFVAAAEGLTEPDAIRIRADHYLRHDYSIHFHVWTQSEMLELLLSVRDRFGFDVELIRKHEHEVVFILRKHEVRAAQPLKIAA